jgi:hypothetical protein
MPRIPTGVVKVERFDFEANIAEAITRQPSDNYNKGIAQLDASIPMSKRQVRPHSLEFYGDLRVKILALAKANPEMSRAEMGRLLNCASSHVRAVLHRYGKSRKEK